MSGPNCGYRCRGILIQTRGWNAPLYWEREGGQWRIMTLGGMRDLNPSEPVCHVSFYEADALPDGWVAGFRERVLGKR